MPNNLVLFQNDTTQKPEDQLQDVNLALTNIQQWAQRISSSIILDNSNDDAQGTSSTSLITIPGYSNNFSCSNPLIEIRLSLSLTSLDTTTISIYLDGQPIKTVKDSVAQTHLLYVTNVLSTFTGQHLIEVKWSTSTLTVSKVKGGGSSLQVINLI